MRTILPVLPPLALAILVGALVAFHADTAGWADQSALIALPHVIFGVAILLGALFTQTRIAFLAFFFAVVTAMGFAARSDGDLARLSALAFLMSLAAPPLTVLFHRLDERGLRPRTFGRRLLAVVLPLLFIAAFAALPAVSRWVTTTRVIVFRPMSPMLALPLAGVLAFLAAAVALLRRGQPHESPRLGALLAIALLQLFGALNFASSLWGPSRGGAAFLLFMCAAGIVLVWTILESAWWRSTIDELTELPGRRALRHHLRSLGPTYAIAIIDIDHFKQVNDTHGHEVGDQVLRFIASHLRRSPVGIAYRQGGEEFVIVCEGQTFESVLVGMDELRDEIAESEFVLRDKDRPAQKPKDALSRPPQPRRTIRITVSIGVSRATRRRATPEAVQSAADRSLYQAKTDGRNRVCATR
jgi:diguanylate cyclase (GGDEF)-like protein